MTLAFYPFGAILAGFVLGVAFTLFGLAFHLLDRAATRTQVSILPGLVSGFRDWTEQRRGPRIAISPSAASPSGEPEIIDLV